MIRVGIVDDHPVVLDGLAASLARQPGIEVAWSAGSLAESRAALEAGACDVVLVDVRLPDGSGMDLIAPSAHGPAFLVLSSFDRPQYARAAYGRGASGYLLKTAPMDEIGSSDRACLPPRVPLGCWTAIVSPLPSRVNDGERELERSRQVSRTNGRGESV